MSLTAPPDFLFAPRTRHLFVFAHQDDELAYAGLLHRLARNAHAVWMTNGDGLAPLEGVAPGPYAETRTFESMAGMRLVGFPPERLEFLGRSELDIYELFKDLSLAPAPDRLPPKVAARARALIAEIEMRIAASVREADVVWTLAWQGGHLEHDLVHWATMRAVRRVEQERGRSIPFFELPEYELSYLVVLRFPPWKRGVVHSLRLSADELALKERMFRVYRSQEKITHAFRRLITVKGLLGALLLRPYSFRAFASVETFGPVPADRDYARPPHGSERLDYMFESYNGRRLTFGNSLSRLIRTGLPHSAA